MKIAERRKHKRFPVVKRLSEPVDIFIAPPDAVAETAIPGVIVDISACGMRLITFAPIDENLVLSLNMDLPAIGRTEMDAKVVWTRQKRGVYEIGMEFIKIPEKVSRKLQEMGKAFEKCIASLANGKTDTCSQECPCYMICDNPARKT
ncbi:MAG: PilZ domain-containing protein [Thermodesulfobacteriota bacterium]|nr:PilZ domain-containing protein [Thermodesulfobacteriota bacterium]